MKNNWQKPARLFLLFTTLLALLVMSVIPAMAATTTLIDKSSVTAELKQTAKKDSYQLTVAGATTTDQIVRIYVKLSGKTYKAVFDKESKTFEMTRTIVLKGNLPTTVTVEATGSGNKKHAVSVNLTKTVQLLDQSSIKVEKAAFLSGYAYITTGKVTKANVVSVDIQIGDRTKTVKPVSRAFKAEIITDDVKTVTITAKDKDGLTESYTYTIK